MSNNPTQVPHSDMTTSLIQAGRASYLPNYQPKDMILSHGKGARLWDTDGNEYIDLGAGIAVNSLGHQDPDLLRALEEQGRKLWHTSNIFFTEPPVRLAEALVAAVPFARRVYFGNSGAEANEAAIKLARKWAAEQGRPPEKREIITFTGSFHGRTLATVTATAQPKFQQGFEPLPGGFTYCDPFGDAAALEACISENTCAILLEPIQGESGIQPAPPGFLKAVRALCDQHGLLMILDEIQTGVGRTGALYAYMHEAGVEPDILTSAKALGCGLPIGAMLVGKRAENVLQYGSHGSTFGGNPLVCAVALAGFQKINTPEMCARVAATGQALVAALERMNKTLGMFTEIRGAGLMIGAELVDAWKGKAAALTEVACAHGVLVLVAGPDVLRFLPPLTITEEELATGLKRLQAALENAKTQDV